MRYSIAGPSYPPWKIPGEYDSVERYLPWNNVYDGHRRRPAHPIRDIHSSDRCQQ